MNSIACNAIESSSIRLQTKVKIFRSEIIILLIFFLSFCLTALSAVRFSNYTTSFYKQRSIINNKTDVV